MIRFSLLCGAALFVFVACGAQDPRPCADEETLLRYGFFASFEPVSYSAESDPNAAGYQRHLGYEADLLTALEAMEHTRLGFERIPIDVWPGIWLAPAGPDYDMAGGGITILESRTRDASGRTVVAFTSGHISFRQSLLIRAEDAERIRSHDDLNAQHRVGAVRGTTGEARLLQLSGLADDEGVLRAGVRIDTADGQIVADGSERYRIDAAEQSALLAERTRLLPADDSSPQVLYLGTDEEAYLNALAEGRIDAFARGEIGNSDAAYVSDGRFLVTALDPAVERGGFVLPAGADALRSCIDERIDWLTDNGQIGYPEWRADAEIFNQRAEAWNRRR